LPNSSGILPHFSASGTTVTAEFQAFNSSLKANSWKIYYYIESVSDSATGYGIQIKNGNNYTIIGDNYPVYQVKSGGTLNYNTITNTSFRLFNLPTGFNINEDIIFVKLTNSGNLFALSRLRYNESVNYRLGSSTTNSLEYRVITTANNLPLANNYGLTIYDGNSNKVYDSGYDIFPSNGQFLLLNGSNTATVDNLKDVWINLPFGVPAPICPNPSFLPTFNLINGIKRSSSTLSYEQVSAVDDAPSLAQSFPHFTNAKIVQR
jgi:hypothetical protein